MDKAQNNENSLTLGNDISGALAKKLGIEYGDLIMATHVSEEQEARIIQILELALTNPEIDFWISHLTSIRGMEAGLLTEIAQKEYDNQKALLREHLGTPNLPKIRGLAAQDVTTQLRSQMGQKAFKVFVAAALDDTQKERQDQQQQS